MIGEISIHGKKIVVVLIYLFEYLPWLWFRIKKSEKESAIILDMYEWNNKALVDHLLKTKKE